MRRTVSAFIEPGSLALLLIALATGVVASRRRGRLGTFGRWWIVVWCVVYLAMSLPAVTRHLITPLAGWFPAITSASQANGIHAVVVLAGGARQYGLGEQRAAVMDAVTTLRVLEAARVYHLLDASIVIASGTGQPRLGEEAAEPKAMRATLVAASVPPDRIVLETTSTNTYDSATEVRNLLRARGITRVVLVTSAYHMPRAMRTFAAAGIDVVGSEAPARPLRPSARWRDFVPDFDALSEAQRYLHEYVGLAYYSLRGWI